MARSIAFRVRHPLTASSLYECEDHRVIGSNSRPRLYHGFATGLATEPKIFALHLKRAYCRLARGREGLGTCTCMQLMDNSDNSDMHHYCDCDCATQSCIIIEAGLCETAGSERGVVLTRQARVIAVCAEENREGGWNMTCHLVLPPFVPICQRLSNIQSQ
jgi:hypothetical protein